MDMKISPSRLSGMVDAVASKSDVHRALICAAFSDRPTRIACNLISKDMEATARCLRAAGAKIEYDEMAQCFLVTPCRETDEAGCGRTGETCGEAAQAECPESPDETGEWGTDGKKRQNTATRCMDCGESGSTLRFMLPVAAALGGTTAFTGAGRLPERPIGVQLAALSEHGVMSSADALPLKLTGKLSGGRFLLPGNISSQFITGFLLAFPLIKAPGEIVLEEALQSKAYVDMTLDTMARFGCKVIETETGYRYEPQDCALSAGYRSPGDYAADGDWSNAAFFLAADALQRAEVRKHVGDADSTNGAEMRKHAGETDGTNGKFEAEKADRESETGGAEAGRIRINGLRADSVQGDRNIAALISAWEAAERGGAPFVMDASEEPDLVPIVSVLCALGHGTAEIIRAGRLRIKECDRLHAMTEGLNALGAAVEELPEGLRIRGAGGRLRGGAAVSGYNDHRIVMALSIAACFCGEPVIITGAEAVEKSYPHFFEDFRKLGGRADGI